MIQSYQTVRKMKIGDYLFTFISVDFQVIQANAYVYNLPHNWKEVGEVDDVGGVQIVHTQQLPSIYYIINLKLLANSPKSPHFDAQTISEFLF